MSVVLTRNMAITSAEINGLRASSWEGYAGRRDGNLVPGRNAGRRHDQCTERGGHR